MGKPKSEKFSQGESKEDMFNGNGVTFKCKLFGSTEVSAPRGNAICAEAIAQLKLKALQRKKESKEHKQKVFLNISVKGIRVLDDKTKKLEHAHVIHRISFISHDATDKRSFGYIVSLKEGYTLFAFRTEKAAEQITTNLKELFDVVFKIYAKKKAAEGGSVNTSTILNDDNTVEPAEEAAEEVAEGAYDVPSALRRADGEKVVAPKTSQLQQGFAEQSTTDDTGNLLDWSDLNDNIAFMQKNMKHSDSSDLLADLTNVNFDDLAPFSPTSNDPFFAGSGGENNGVSPSGSDAFGMNPFSPAAPATSKTLLAASHSDSDIVTHASNPFGDDHFSASTNVEIGKSKSMNFSDTTKSDGNNPFGTAFGQPAPAQATHGLHDLDFTLSTQQTQSPATSDMAGMRLNDQWNQPSQGGSIFDSPSNQAGDLLAPTMSPSSSVMTPQNSVTPSSNDPFASLGTNIDSIRGDLPSSDKGASGFPTKTKPSDTVTLNSMAASRPSQSSPQRVMPMMQQQRPPVPMPYQQQLQYSGAPIPAQSYPFQSPASANNPFLAMGGAQQAMRMPGAQPSVGAKVNAPMAFNPQPAYGVHPQSSTGGDALYATVDKSYMSSGVDPLAQFGLAQKPQTTPASGNQNDLLGLDLLQ